MSEYDYDDDASGSSDDQLSEDEREYAIQQYRREKNMSDEELDAEIRELQSRLQSVQVDEVPATPPATSEAIGNTNAPQRGTSRRSENFGEAPRCEHIKSNNQACGSPALKGKRYCHFHAQLRPGRKPQKEVRLPVLEDDRAIQMAVTKICQGVVDDEIEPKRATAVLYGLQVASNAVRRSARKPRK